MKIKTHTFVSTGKLIYEFFPIPTIRLDDRWHTKTLEICWLDRYWGVLRRSWNEAEEA